ncbi:hypothetical protein A1F96_06262 [Pyrenophora tritici-repentis]|nr:hypothetical protein A1F96_06262 [Pyrenophora tritici-repentis]
MTNPWADSYTSNSNPSVPEYDGVQDVSQETYYYPTISSAPVGACNPWVLEGSHCSSPLSELCRIEYFDVSTPSYEDVARYEEVGPHFQDIPDPLVDQNFWKSEPELWQHDYARPFMYSSQSYVLPPDVNYTHNQPQDSAYADGFASQHTHPTTRPVNSVPSWFQEPTIETRETANQESNSQSASESDNSDNDDPTSQKSSTSTIKETCAAPKFMKLGKWTGNSDITTSKERIYKCHEDFEKCQWAFAQPDHLRRHINAVHKKDELYWCKVKDCQKKCTREDNLYQHYMTHIKSGGRAGKNTKMSFDELIDILGDEKKLVRRLTKKHTQKPRKKRILIGAKSKP